MDDIPAFDLQQLTFPCFSLHMFRFHFIQKLPQLVNRKRSIENMQSLSCLTFVVLYFLNLDFLVDCSLLCVSPCSVMYQFCFCVLLLPDLFCKSSVSCAFPLFSLKQAFHFSSALLPHVSTLPNLLSACSLDEYRTTYINLAWFLVFFLNLYCNGPITGDFSDMFLNDYNECTYKNNTLESNKIMFVLYFYKI